MIYVIQIVGAPSATDNTKPIRTTKQTNSGANRSGDAEKPPNQTSNESAKSKKKKKKEKKNNNSSNNNNN